MAENVLGKAAGLPQSNATWQATARRAPVWITPKREPPYRPYVILVVDATTDRVRQSDIGEERPAPEHVLMTLAGAMLRPVAGGGKRCRPARVLLDDAELAQALAEPLAAIGVRCDYQAMVPAVKAALHSMEAHLTRRTPLPGLLSVPGVTVPLVAELFAAAADFYRRAPWRWMDNLQVLEVRYPADGPARYIVIMGNGGEEFGLSLYPTLEALQTQLSTVDDSQSFKKITATSITFDEPTALAFEDLDALEQYGWEVANAQAFPLLMKITPPAKVSVPSANEIALLAAALRAIPDFVQQQLRADRGRPRAAQAAYALPTVHGNQQIALRYPVDLPALKALRAEADLEDAGGGVAVQDLIEGWNYDKSSPQFALELGAFLLQFMDHLAMSGLSEQTLDKHGRNCWLIGHFTCDYGDTRAFSPAIFLGGPQYLPEFERKVTSATAASASYRATWRKLDAYVRALGYGEGSR
jgi:hypothetical protein